MELVYRVNDLRIVSGKYRGRKLFAPKGMSVRPTSDRVREAIFSVLGPIGDDIRVMDLFAGSGALGLEAISRGAASAVFVDNRPASLAAVKRNVEAMELGDRIRLVKLDLSRPLGRLKEWGPYDLFFLDPPYGSSLIEPVLTEIGRAGLAAPGAWAVVEHGRDESPSGEPFWTVDHRREYGGTAVTFYFLTQSYDKERILP